jgi:hypothetical protein
MEIDRHKINRAISKEKNIWGFGNSVLYRLCQEHPRHDKTEIVIAKIWLIGRSYAAAIERRDPKFDGGIPNDSFYVNTVAPALIRSEIDKRIDQLRQCDAVRRDTLPAILRTHGYLAGVFKNITGKNKRSLASKYLHFHLPNHFYLYDSRAARAVQAMQPIRAFTMESAADIDREYMRFSTGVLALQEQIERQFSKRLSPRELDNLLLNRVS